MGCGQSKIGSLYSRSKAKHKKALQPPATSASTGGAGGGEDDGGGGGGDGDGEGGSSTPASPSASAEAEARRKALASRVRQVLSSGPLLAQAEVSSSQLDFFRMLDERIESVLIWKDLSLGILEEIYISVKVMYEKKGPDYVSGSDDDVLSVPERQSSLPEDEQHGCCRLETQSLTLSPDAEDARETPPAGAAGRRPDGRMAAALATSAPSPGDGIKSPVMNGELRRWDGPPPVTDAGGGGAGGARQGNGLGGGNVTAPRAKAATPKNSNNT